MNSWLSQNKGIAIFRDHPAENWPSMERYANGLIIGLRQIEQDIPISECVPPSPWKLPYGLLFRRLIQYPKWAHRHQAQVNHIIDHSYGNLLYSLDPNRSIVTVHDIAPYHFSERRLSISGFIWKWAWRGARRARMIITVSEFIRQEIVNEFKLPPDKVITIHSGVNPEFRRLDPDICLQLREKYDFRQESVILNVGSNQRRKNLETLLSSLAHLREHNLDFLLVQAGSTPTPEQYDYINNLKLQKHVRFLGYVPDTDLVGLYNLATVFVFPSLYEGFGLPVLESMACGTPVIAADAASLPEVTGNAGILVDPRSATAMAEAVYKVISNPELAEELSKRGLTRAKQFTWKETARKTLAVYHSVANSI